MALRARRAERRQRVLAGDCDGPEEVVAACGERAGRRARRQGARAGAAGARPRHAARRLPARARRGAATRSRSCAKSAAWRATSRTRSAADALLLGALADWQREQIAERGLEGVMREIELPLVPVLREMELLGVRLNLERLAEITGRVREEIAELERRDLRARRRGVHDRLAPAARARSCSRSSACRASAAARPATRPTRACCRRSAPSTRSCPRSSAGASSRR